MIKFCFQIVLLSIWGVIPVLSQAQQTESHQQIEEVITTMFDGFRTNDSSLVASAFYDRTPYLGTSGTRNSIPFFKSGENFEQLLSAIAQPKSESEKWDEQIYDLTILEDETLAMVYCPYKFYRGATFSHCGVNFFTLTKTEQGWKIISIVDTRRVDECE